MDVVQEAKQIKAGIEKLKKKGVKVLDGTREAAELQLLLRDKNKIKGDLAARGISFDDL